MVEVENSRLFQTVLFNLTALLKKITVVPFLTPKFHSSTEKAEERINKKSCINNILTTSVSRYINV